MWSGTVALGPRRLHGTRTISRQFQRRRDSLKLLAPKRSRSISLLAGEMLALPQRIVSVLDQEIG